MSVNIQVNVTESVSPQNVATVDRPDLNLIGNTFSKQQTRDEITTAQLTGVKGEATPTSSPSPWQNGDPDLYEKWDVNTVGTYTNFLNGANPRQPIVITVDDLNNYFVQIRVKNGVASKSTTPKPKAGEFTVIPFSNVIKFEVQKSISKTTLSANLTYSYYGGSAILNSVQVHEIIPNGFAITFDNSFSTQIQADIDYSKPISVLFHKPLTPNLKPLAIVVNISEIDNTLPLPRYKVNSVGGTTINTWFEWFEFPAHTVTSDDCVYNVGFFNYNGSNFVGCNFTKVGSGAVGRWANFAILEAEWQPNTIYEINGTSIIGARFKTGSVKPTTLVQANTANHTLVEI